MTLQNMPFVSTTLDEDKKVDSFTVRVNDEERKLLEDCKKILEQPKDSSALKQLAWLGAKVLHDDLTAYTLGVVFRNKRNNKRLGIIEFEV